MNSMEKTRVFLKSIGLPEGDDFGLPTSDKRFADGGQYRFEVPGIQGPKVMQALLEAMDSYGLYLHRVTQTQGIMRLTDNEIVKMVELAHKWETDLILAIGPRATTDTSASVNTEEGVRMGYRLRGQEQIVRAIEDVKRAARLGCRGFRKLSFCQGLSRNSEILFRCENLSSVSRRFRRLHLNFRSRYSGLLFLNC